MLIDLKCKTNIRHSSVRKKTASRICSTQILYEASFLIKDINLIIKSYIKNHLPIVLKDLNIKNIDINLFDTIILGVNNNKAVIDKIISNNLAQNWSIDRLSKTELSVLRLATFELCFERKFKKITIINEYVSILEIFGGNANFANGILENISKKISIE